MNLLTAAFTRKNPRALAHCKKHGEQRWFIACLCVLKFYETVKYFKLPTAEAPGEILCKKSGFMPPHGDGQHHRGECVMLCEKCAREHRLVGVGSKMR